MKLVGECRQRRSHGRADERSALLGQLERRRDMGSLFRTLAGMSPPATVDRARFYALLYLTAADTAIATWKDKAKWMFWRPVTAIQLGDDDGNPDTKGDPGWQSLIRRRPTPTTPRASPRSAGRTSPPLQELFGTDRVAFGGTNRAGFTRNYTRLSEAVDEIVDARVWSGIHFRIADVQGAKIGREVARARRAHHLLRAAPPPPLRLFRRRPLRGESGRRAGALPLAARRPGSAPSPRARARRAPGPGRRDRPP